MARGKAKKKEPETPQRQFTFVSQIEVSKEVLRRLERDLKRGAFKVLTPYTLAQAYNIRISTAKKVLREAVKQGLLVLYSGGRVPIYIKPETK